VTIRVYNRAPLRASVVREAEALVTRWLGAARIAVTWRDCSGTRQCPDPPADHDLLVRVVPGVAPANPGFCGMAVLPPDGGPGKLATVFAGCVGRAWQDLSGATGRHDAPRLSRLSEGRVLAVVIGHEVIHLVAPGRPHARHGVMRARIGRDDWLALAADDRTIGAALLELVHVDGDARRVSRIVANRHVVAGLKPRHVQP
jgi:hypothetical protein